MREKGREGERKGGSEMGREREKGRARERQGVREGGRQRDRERTRDSVIPRLRVVNTHFSCIPKTHEMYRIPQKILYVRLFGNS